MSTDNKTLADAQPGGRVRLGDGVRCSKCEGRGYFDVDVDVDDSGGSIGNIEACPHCTLSAQPSPGGQWGPEIEQLHKLVSSILSTVSLGYQTGPYAYAGEDFGGYLHEAASNCRTILRGLSNIAARQPVRIYGCCAQPEGELHTAECPNMRHLAACQPVVAVPQGCDACERTGIRQNDEGRNVFCPDCDLGKACTGDTRQPVGDQHPDDLAVDAFAAAMKAKMAEARAKGRGGWEDPAHCSAEDLSRMLRDHVEKGDPRDVANFCMMLHQRGEAIAARQPVGEPVADECSCDEGGIRYDAKGCTCTACGKRSAWYMGGRRIRVTERRKPWKHLGTPVPFEAHCTWQMGDSIDYRLDGETTSRRLNNFHQHWEKVEVIR